MTTNPIYTNCTLRGEEVDGRLKWLTLDSTWSLHPLDADVYSDYNEVQEAVSFILKAWPLRKNLEQLQICSSEGEPIYSLGFGVRFRLEMAAKRKLRRNALKKAKEIFSKEELDVLGLTRKQRVHQTAQTKRREYES